MTSRIGYSIHSVWPRAAVVLAAGIILVAAMAYATVKIDEPSVGTISASDVIGVARVNRVLGREPFTNKNPQASWSLLKTASREPFRAR